MPAPVATSPPARSTPRNMGAEVTRYGVLIRRQAYERIAPLCDGGAELPLAAAARHPSPLTSSGSDNRTGVRPAFVPPMKAVLTAERPGGPEWVFERKLDGFRCLAVKDGGPTRLYSRNELSLNDRYAPLAAALDADPGDDFVIDGEAVAFVGGRGRVGGGGGGELFFFIFAGLF